MGVRWFQHPSDERQTAFQVELEHHFGMAGVGRYYRVLETIAAAMTAEHPQPEATLTLRKWRKILSANERGLMTFLTFCKESGQLEYEQVSKNFPKVSEKFLQIGCPRLLKLRDQHTKRSVVTTERLQSDYRVKGKPEPAPEPDEADRLVWRVGITLLTSAGYKEAPARAFLGKAVKECGGGEKGKAKVAEAIARTASERPVDPVPFIRSLLKPKGNGSVAERARATTEAIRKERRGTTQGSD